MVGVLEEKIKKWYPIYTQAKAEKKTAERLQKCGIEVYLPLKRVEKQWSDRKKILLEPLLNSYLFVKIYENQLSEVSAVQGFARYIYFSGKIASIPDKQIEDLKLLIEGSEHLEIEETDLSAGQKVIIKSGPFKGIQAELLSLKQKRKIVLKIHNLGLSIVLNTSLKNIERLK